MQRTKLNLKKIAEMLGVSVTTVSRVLNGQAAQYRISLKTEQKVMDFARRHNFTPNEIARNLRLSKTNTIGLVVPDISNPFFASIARSIENEARHEGYFVFLCDSKDDTPTEAELIKLLLQRKVDGLILAPVGLDATHLNHLQQEGIPVVLIDRSLPEVSFPVVASDNFQGAYEAVTYLIRHGHTRIACLQGIPGTTTNESRIMGYQQALQEASIPVLDHYIVGHSYGEEDGYQSTQQLLKMHPRPTAFFCLSNLISLGALRAIAEHQLKVPEDISMISFDEQPYAAFLSTPMTTVEQHQEDIGRKAVQLLLRSSPPNASQPLLLPTQLIQRSSVKKIEQAAIDTEPLHQDKA